MPETYIRLSARPASSPETVTLAEIVTMMTFALDMSEGAHPGHALRSCVLGMRLASALGIHHSLRESLFYALLLKDVGCSSNAARLSKITGGDDRALKAANKLADWTKPHRVDLRTLKTVWRNVRPDSSAAHRVARMAHMAVTQHKHNRELIELRCSCGAAIVRAMGLGDVAAQAVLRLDEHWDGSGYPGRLEGFDIPVLARICSVAQTLDVFAAEDGAEAAVAILRKRSGTWFDPKIVLAAERLHASGHLWLDCQPGGDTEATRRTVLALDPARGKGRPPQPLTEDRIDVLCETLAGIVDAKSPFPYPHSTAVAETAVAIALEMDLAPDRVRLVRRAALLHDLGKLHVSNTILDKPGKLSEEDWGALIQHPGLTRTLLARVPAFTELATVAGDHHERLNGTGYPLGRTGQDLPVESRIVALADCFTSMAEDRPYRKGLELDRIFHILDRDVPHLLDFSCFEALRSALNRGNERLPARSKAPWRVLRKPPQSDWPAAALRQAV